MSISTKKPDSIKNRFGQAKEFATSENNQNEAMPHLRIPKKTTETFRENFDLDVSLGKDMRKFLIDSKEFRSKREFLTQCVKDGLKKYARE